MVIYKIYLNNDKLFTKQHIREIMDSWREDEQDPAKSW